MAIKTFISKGDEWAQINAASAINVNMSMNTWDPTKIDWMDYTVTPVDITWSGTFPDPMIGGAMTIPGNNANCQYINGDGTWVTTATTYSEFSKPAGVRPDILMGFFSQFVHAMLFITDELTYTVPFMERLGLIWIQHELNKWTAYDRKEFYAFIDNPDATTFNGSALNKKDIQKRISEAKDE